MRNRQYPLISMLLVFAVIFWVWGCEQQLSAPIVHVDNSKPSIDDYFPLTSGKSSVLVSVNSVYEPDIVTREEFVIGEGLTENDKSIHTMFHRNLDYSSISDTSYFYHSGNALYFYETADSDPEKILEEPLEIGKSWERFINPDFETDNLFDKLLGSLQSKDSDLNEIVIEEKNNPPEGLLEFGGKVFPTVGSGLMTIVAIENVELRNGQTLENCIKIKNEGGSYTNYYWYALNKGLIKYVIGANDDNLATSEELEGVIVGELGSSNEVLF